MPDTNQVALAIITSALHYPDVAEDKDQRAAYLRETEEAMRGASYSDGVHLAMVLGMMAAALLEMAADGAGKDPEETLQHAALRLAESLTRPEE